MATNPGFKSQCQSSPVAPFPTLPTISYSCQHSHIFPAFLGCHSKSRQVWSHGMEPIISKLSHRHCNQGELPPSYLMGWCHSHLPGSQHGHSYLTYPWNQSKVIDMLNDHSRGYLQNCCNAKLLNGPAPCVSSPSSDLWGWGHPIFLIFPGHPEFWNPLQIPIWGGPGLHPVIWTPTFLVSYSGNSSGTYSGLFGKPGYLAGSPIGSLDGGPQSADLETL